MAPTAVPAAVKSLMEDVQLDKMADQLAGTLSGGQKRRLSLALALSGNSKVSRNRDTYTQSTHYHTHIKDRT